MRLQKYPFDQLPFSKLFKTYTSDFERLSPLYAADPFDMDAVRTFAGQKRYNGDKEKAVDLLRSYNDRFDLEQAAYDNIERLGEKETLALVTGQQLGMYGGPLFTAFKISSTIHLANILTEKLDRTVVPIFWLADEDHDYEEIRSVHIFDRDELNKVQFESPSQISLPVSQIQLDGNYSSLRDRLRENLLETDFSDRLWELLDDCYKPGVQLDQAFGNLIGKLFSKYGLVLAGSNWKPIKQQTRECMKVAVKRSDEIRNALEIQTRKVGEEFHQQAMVHDSNLFYLDEKDGRTKIIRNGESWQTDGGRKWQTEELLNEIEANPERFSPNVFLRPVLQDELIPTLGYVAGPGEVAYYGQMKELYEIFGQKMPVIFPRLSGTFIEPSIDRILDELPFEISDYNRRIEDLESEYVENAEQHDIEAIFADWKQKVEKIGESKTDQIQEIDPTLEGASGKAVAVFLGELDKLKGKVYRSVKQQEETQLKRIRRIKKNLYPESNLQEREISFIYFMNKYGIDLWDRLIEELDEEELFSHHQLIYL